MSIENIIQLSAVKHNVTSAEILGRSRKGKIVKARHEAIYRIWRENPELTETEIGRQFGGRKACTVLYIIKKVGYNMV